MNQVAYPVILAALLSVLPGQTQGAAPESGLRQRRNFDCSWRFQRGDVAGAEKVGFVDATWRTLDLPHDWSIEPATNVAVLGPNEKPSGTQTPPPSESKRKKSEAQEDLPELQQTQNASQQGIFDPASSAEHSGAYLNAGKGWYRKTFALPPALRNKHVFIEFEGVYMNSDVWLNGRHLGFRPYGYSSFEYELTPYLSPDGTNLLAVRVNVEQPCSRWYSGAGIYRHVWLTATEAVHVVQSGTAVTTPEVDVDSAVVRVRTMVTNQLSAPVPVTLRTVVLDPKGKVVASESQSHPIAGAQGFEFDQQLRVPQPQLWSPDAPCLCTVRSEVSAGDKPSDIYTTDFGIRSYQFTRENGMILNGRRFQLNGVCLHHDQGCLGSAAFDRAIERQLEIMKDMGANAVRTSHNPPAPKLLELCDRMGLLVIDEAFDEWRISKRSYGYARYFDGWHERDLVDMIHRDRNHPSVILWSIGNEIPDMGRSEGVPTTKRLVEICHREDPSRPVTAGCNNPATKIKVGAGELLDVTGINYTLAYYDKAKGAFPTYSSESASDVSSRGEYNLVLRQGTPEIEAQLNNQVSSYDIYAPSWAFTAEVQLLKLMESPWMAGEFVWTGFDYLGEPTPFKWPSVSSYFGIVDLCGFPKDRFYLYQSQWTQKPLVHILPHWNWPGWEGREIPVWCYANADTVELFLNGKSLGRKRCCSPLAAEMLANARKAELRSTNGLHVSWLAPYQPGVLKAVARRGNKVVARDEVHTVGAPARLELKADRTTIRATGQDLAYVTVRVVDKHGNLCPTADCGIHFSAEGAVTLAAVGNGDATSHEQFLSDHRKAFNGMCLAIAKSGKEPGQGRITAISEGLKPGTAKLTVRSKP